MASSMSVAFVCVLFLLPTVGSASQFSGSAVDQASRERPINKIINLLKDMKSKLESEADEDQAIYDAMVCWCETNEKAKTKSVADGIQQDKDLTAKIPELAAHGAQLDVDIKQLQKEIVANEKALAEATALRAKELAEFNTEEKDLVGSITGMQNAVLALSKPNAALNQQALLQIQNVLQPGRLRASGVLQKLSLPEAQKRQLLVMLQQERKQLGHLQEHAPASAEIFGLMKGMKESFEANLANAQKEEKDAVATFAKLKSIKTEEISSAKNQVSTKTGEMASTDENREQSKEDLENTKEQVSADQAFLLDLQERCGSMDKQFADRQKLRGEETKAVSEALKILTDDESKEAFDKSTRFFQTSMRQTVVSGREQAIRILKDAAKRIHSPKLALVATSLKEEPAAEGEAAAPAPVGAGNYGAVEEVLNKLTASLKKEQEDDVAQRDVCIDDLNKNDKDLAAKFSEKSDLETKIEELTLLISNENDKVKASKAEIAENEKEMKIASENREKANHEYQTMVTEQRATQDILARVLKKLADFYRAAALAQVKTTTKQHAASAQAPPAGFGEYKKAGGAGGAMGMIENIVAESKQIETEAVADEASAQKAYEQFIKDSNDSIDSLNKAIVDSTEAAAKADAEKVRSQSDLGTANTNIDDLNSFRALTHGACDFLLKNFEMRQSMRTEEMEALEQAKSVMHGANGF